MRGIISPSLINRYTPIYATLVLTIAWRRCRRPTRPADDLQCPSGACSLISLSIYIYISLCASLSVSSAHAFGRKTAVGERERECDIYDFTVLVPKRVRQRYWDRNRELERSLEWAMQPREMGHGRWQWGTVTNLLARIANPTTAKFTISSFTWPIVRNVYAMLLVILYSNIWNSPASTQIAQIAIAVIAVRRPSGSKPNT